MIAYTMPPHAGTHSLRAKGGQAPFDRLITFLERYTDCAGPHRIDDDKADLALDRFVQPTRKDVAAPPPPSCLRELAAALSDAESRLEKFSVSAWLQFLFRDPETRDVLAYSAEHVKLGAFSSVLVFVRPGSTTLYANLYWPTDLVDDMVPYYDAALETMGLRLSPKKFAVVSPTRGGVPKLRRFTFDRYQFGARQPAGDRAETLRAAIRAAPDDDGARLAYADWLIQCGDPLGEMIVLQCRLAQLASDDPARRELERRERALLAKHGRMWLAIPRVQGATMRRGFVESIELDHVETLLMFGDEILTVAPLLREVVLPSAMDLQVLRNSRFGSRITGRLKSS